MNISGVNRIRVLVLAGCVLLVILYIRFFIPDDDLEQGPLYVPSPSSPVLVTVFYETLCPDSKHFVRRQLESTYGRAGAYMDVRLVAYGKATTTTNKDGSLSFDCQHGPIECDGNRIHACVVDVVQETELQISLISCMIQDNLIPRDAFHRCFDEHKVNPDYLPRIQQCFEGTHGDELLKINGELTHAIRPKISFIPTVTLDGALLNQADILRDLFTEVCNVISGRGPRPDVCQPPETHNKASN